MQSLDIGIRNMNRCVCVWRGGLGGLQSFVWTMFLFASSSLQKSENLVCGHVYTTCPSFFVCRPVITSTLFLLFHSGLANLRVRVFPLVHSLVQRLGSAPETLSCFSFHCHLHHTFPLRLGNPLWVGWSLSLFTSLFQRLGCVVLLVWTPSSLSLAGDCD